MMNARTIVERILDELKRGNADRLHQLMVRCASALGGNRRCTHAFEGLEPFAKDGYNGRIAFGIDTANLPRPIVDVEVGCQIVIARARRDRPPVLPAVVGMQLVRDGIRRRSPRRKMLLNVGKRTAQDLLFTRPQREADRALWPMLSLDSILAASMLTALPAALSPAPSAATQLSRCAPAIT